jgi:DNA modification methylase
MIHVKRRTSLLYLKKRSWYNARMLIEKRKISELVPAPYNPRTISDAALAGLTASIERFGLVDLLIVNKNGRVIGGHQRLKVPQAQGVQETDCVIVDLDETEEKALNVALNNQAISGEFTGDLQIILEELKMEMPEEFEALRLDELYRPEPKAGLVDPDDVPEKVEPICQRGQIWSLGNHRLMCGDSTDAGDVALLMDGKKADMVFTDPPYGVSYESKTKGIVNQRKNIQPVSGDELGRDALKDIVFPVFQNIAENLKNGGCYYVCSPQGGELGLMMMMMDAGIECRHMIVWAKDRAVFSMGRLDYDYQHEPILYGWRGSHKHIGNGQFKTSVWNIPNPRASKLHPTMKPVEVMQNALLNSSKAEGIVLDLFLGSGSTLIAAEQTQRICYGMEIDAHYCDVIIARWQSFTGRKAELLETAIA